MSPTFIVMKIRKMLDTFLSLTIYSTKKQTFNFDALYFSESAGV